jgi:hypothetical protein
MKAKIDFSDPNSMFLEHLPEPVLEAALQADFIDEPIWDRQGGLSVLSLLRRLGYAVTNIYVYERSKHGPSVPPDGVYDREFDASVPQASWSTIVEETAAQAESYVRSFVFPKGVHERGDPLFSFWAFDEPAFRRFQAAEA